VPWVVAHFLVRPILGGWWQRYSASRLGRHLRRGQQRRQLYSRWIRPEFAARTGLVDIVDQSQEVSIPVNGWATQQRYRRVFDSFNGRVATWLERNCARFGLEALDPWGDRRVAEFVLAVPQRAIHRPGVYKWLTRQAAQGLMPEEVRTTARKVFPLPFYQRAITEQARAAVEDLLRTPELDRRGYVDSRALWDYYQAASQQGFVDSGPFYNLLTLEMWLRQYWT